MEVEVADSLARSHLREQYSLAVGELSLSKLVKRDDPFAPSRQEHDCWFLNYDPLAPTFDTAELDVMSLAVDCVTGEVALLGEL